jgi:hypothetical protein
LPFIKAIIKEAEKYINSNTKESEPEEAINLFLKYPFMRDIRQMMNFNVNLNNIDKEVLNAFVQTFNDNLEQFSTDEHAKVITDIDKFFQYWISIIHDRGYRMLLERPKPMTISQLIAKKYDIHPEQAIMESETAIEWLYGERFGFNCHD